MKKILLILLLTLIFQSYYLTDEKLLKETRVDKVWTELNIKGDSVIVAILDRGIDYTHPDFTNDDGTTRILYIFDLTDNTGANSYNNPYQVGTIYNEEQINSSLTSGTYISPATNQDRDQKVTGEFNYYHNGSQVDFYNAENNKREIMIDFKTIGNYTLRLKGTKIVNGRFHASLNPSRIFSGNGNAFETFAVPGYTIWDLASVKNNIVPNSYVIRQNWKDINGVTRTDIGNEVGEGALWLGSGIGPTYDERIGITVSIPGNSNISTYAEHSYFASFDHVLIKGGNRKYGIQSAVSGAAPVLTGIIALMLQANPELNSIQVKEILQNTARSDAFTGTTPNTKWGYGKADAFAAVSEVLNATSVQNTYNVIPQQFRLEQNYPNPFNPTTTISYSIPNLTHPLIPSRALPIGRQEGKERSERGVLQNVRLKVYDILGKEVATLVNKKQTAGSYKVTFDASVLPSGIYFYKIIAGDFAETKKMVLLQ